VDGRHLRPIMESRLEECEEYRGSREGHPCQQIPVDATSSSVFFQHAMSQGPTEAEDVT